MIIGKIAPRARSSPAKNDDFYFAMKACELKTGNFFVEGTEIFRVVSKKTLKTKHHDLHFTVQSMTSDRRSTRHWAHGHEVRAVEPDVHHYKIVGVTTEARRVDPNAERYVVLDLLDVRTNELRSDMLVSDPGLMTYLLHREDKELDAYVYNFSVDPAHRDEQEIKLEKLVSVQGYDMSHAYDHHHGHHHGHGHGHGDHIHFHA